MDDRMRDLLKGIEKTRQILGDQIAELAQVCDHKDEVGSWARYYDPHSEQNCCVYCHEEL